MNKYDFVANINIKWFDWLCNVYYFVNKALNLPGLKQSRKPVLMKKPDVIIEPLTSHHLKETLQIADNQLGKGYVETRFLTDPEAIAHVAVSHLGRVLGFSCGKLFTRKELGLLNKKLPDELLRFLPDKSKTGLTLSLAVDGKAQHEGVGTALFEARIRTFFNHDASGILMPGWQKPDGSTSIDPLAQKYGFKALGIVKNFFYHDSLKRQYRCPVCGPPPCRCGAVVYWKGV